MSTNYPRAPVGPWVGRLLFDPTKRHEGKDVVQIELQHTPPEHRGLINNKNNTLLQWADTPATKEYLIKTLRDVSFTEAAHASAAEGNLHPWRLDGLKQVGPLESLAGSRPENDMQVILGEPVVVRVDDSSDGNTTLYIEQEPIQTSGVFYSVVTILGRNNKDEDLFDVQHFSLDTKSFDGPTQVVRIPQHHWKKYLKSTNEGIEQSHCNPSGWFMYGNVVEGTFVVQAIEPRHATSLEPDNFIVADYYKARHFITTENWARTHEKAGLLETTLVDTNVDTPNRAVEKWQEGDNLVVIHLFGGLKGPRRNEAQMGIVTGHFAYGHAVIVRDALTKELRFDIDYHQVYAHNEDEIIAGRTKRYCYMGDLYRGWLGCRPVSDILIDIDLVTKDYHFGDDITISPFSEFQEQLQIMMARYRVGDGTGVSVVDAVRSCVQDSNQALYVALDKVEDTVRENDDIQKWLQAHPEDPETIRFRKLQKMGDELHQRLAPFGSIRADWRRNANEIAVVEKHGMLRNILRAIASILSVFPRRSHDVMARFLLDHDAALWFIRTNQVGGENHDVGPLEPTTSGGLSFCG